MGSDGGDGGRARPRSERHDSDPGWAAGAERIDVGFTWAPSGAAGASPFHPVIRHGGTLAVGLVALVVLGGLVVAAPAMPALDEITESVDGAFTGSGATATSAPGELGASGTVTDSPTATPSPTPRPTASPTVSPTASPSPTPTASPSPTPTPTATATATPTPTPVPTTPTASPEPSSGGGSDGGSSGGDDGGSSTPEPTSTPTASPTATPTDTPTDSPTATPTDSPTATPTDSPTATPTDSPTPCTIDVCLSTTTVGSWNLFQAQWLFTLGLTALVLTRRD